MSKRRTDLDAVRRDIADQGAMSAYRTLLAVCDSADAPAQAKAAAGVAVLRAAGLLDAKSRPSDEPPTEMSAEQLRQSLPILQKELERLEEDLTSRAKVIAALDADEDEDDADIFA